MIDTADLPTAWRVRVLVDAAVQIAHFATGMGDHCEQNVDHSCPRKAPILGATQAEKGRLYLTDDNKILLEFLDFHPDEVAYKRIGFDGEEMVRRNR